MKIDSSWRISALTGKDGDLRIQYSKTGSDGDWHDEYEEGDLYIRTSSNGEEWSSGMRFVGENGDPAKFVEISAPDGTMFMNDKPEKLTLVANAIGFNPTKFQWYRNGVAIEEATSSVYEPTEAGTYKIIIDDVYEDIQTVLAVYDGQNGSSPYAFSISNEAVTIATDINRFPLSAANYDVVFNAFHGTEEMTAVEHTEDLKSGQFKIASYTEFAQEVERVGNDTLRFKTSTASAIPANQRVAVTIEYYNDSINAPSTVSKDIEFSVAKEGNSAISAMLSNPNCTVSADSAGSSSGYDRTPTNINVYEGVVPLKFNNMTATTNFGYWWVTKVDASGFGSGGKEIVVVDEYTGRLKKSAAVTASSHTGKRTINIAGVSTVGKSFTFTLQQTISLAMQGDKGAKGSGYIGVYASNSTHAPLTSYGEIVPGTEEGDYYLSSTANTIYKKENGVWTEKPYNETNKSLYKQSIGDCMELAKNSGNAQYAAVAFISDLFVQKINLRGKFINLDTLTRSLKGKNNDREGFIKILNDNEFYYSITEEFYDIYTAKEFHIDYQDAAPIWIDDEKYTVTKDTVIEILVLRSSSEDFYFNDCKCSLTNLIKDDDSHISRKTIGLDFLESTGLEFSTATGAIYGGAYDKNGTSTDDSADGCYIDSSGILKAKNAKFINIKASGGKFDSVKIGNNSVFDGYITQGASFYMLGVFLIEKNNSGFTFNVNSSKYTASDFEFFQASTGMFLIHIPSELYDVGFVEACPLVHYASDVSFTKDAITYTDVLNGKKATYNGDPRYQINVRSGEYVYKYNYDGTLKPYLPIYFTDFNEDNYINPVIARFSILLCSGK